MSIDQKRILFKHLREHRLFSEGRYAPSCAKRWAESHGLNWKEFCYNGYTVSELRSAVSPDIDGEVEELIEFLEANNLWEDGS